MLKILSPEAVKDIHEAGKRILEEVGIRVHSKRVYDLLVASGAVPKGKDGISLCLPVEMVEHFMKMCPRRFAIKNRKNEETIVENGAPPLYYTSNATLYVRGTGKKAHEIGESDFIDFIRTVNELGNVHGLVGTSMKEYPPALRDFVGFKHMAQYTYKHLRPCIYTPSGAEAILEMADIILEGKPLKEQMFFTLGYSIVSPLTWSETALELFYRTRGHGIPMMINSEPMAGGTSPVTLAGSLALADAEVISGIVINQVMEPGRPCIYNSGFAHVMDMRTTIVLTGAPENALLQAAGAEMAAFHGFPCASWALSDSLMLDSQASYEKLLTLLAHTLSNVNFIWGIGNIETSKTISPEIAVIDEELIGNSLRFSKGIAVDEEHIALDVIKETAFQSSFLETEHTFQFFKEEIRNSSLPNRVTRTAWEVGGSKSIEEKAEATVTRLLAKAPETYLSGSQRDRLEKVQKKWSERILAGSVG